MIQLSQLVGELTPPIELNAKQAQIEITGLAIDSRNITRGCLFAALEGTSRDGRDYIKDALKAGAKVIMVEGEPASWAKLGQTPPSGGVKVNGCFDLADERLVIGVVDAKATIARLAARFYCPQPAKIVAITGTNGKTSVASFVRQIWNFADLSAASIGTIGLTVNNQTVPGNLTTPDPVYLHCELQKLAAAGVNHVVLEASSHGLDQRRLDGFRFIAGAFTNLSRDHLDYHRDMDSYFSAKLRLVNELMAVDAGFVVDVDTKEGESVALTARMRGLQTLTVGAKGDDIRLIEAHNSSQGQILKLEVYGQQRTVNLAVIGDFQASNCMVALGLALLTGVGLEVALKALANLRSATGRLDLAAILPSGAKVYVDYAHTPAALKVALNALRAITAGRLIVVFGAGGDRDKGKRPLMGSIATKNADIVIITDDNPRTENPARIRRDILADAPGAEEIASRREAITSAIGIAEDGDAILVAGKGHETGQIIKTQTIPYSDYQVIASINSGFLAAP